MGILGRLLRIAALIALASTMAGAPAWAAKRVALVIGNSTYRNVPRLDNPSNDAKLMARTLLGLGFELVGGGAQVDLDKPHFDAALQSFSNEVQGADVGLFYYAGHGLQVGGRNFLVPVEANPTKEADVYLQMVDTQIVLSQMEGAGTKLNIVLLDACRNNPFGVAGLRATGGGLAQMQAPEGTLISYATQPGNVALDGAKGDSPYTMAVAETISRPGLGLFDAFNEVGLSVKRATGGAQQPWLASSPIEGRFSFAEPAPAVATADGAGAAPIPVASPTPVASSPPVAKPTPVASPAPATPEPVQTLASARSADQPAAAPTQIAALGGQQAAAPPITGAAAVAECDRLAAGPSDATRPAGVPGIGFKDMDGVKAVAACRAALAEQPTTPRIMFELARAIDKVQGPNDEAGGLMRKAATAGDPAAMYSVGYSFESGQSGKRDFAEALRWYRKSADGGSGIAMHRLGLVYEGGESVPQDRVEALRWYRKAADAGSPLGMIDVGRAYESNDFGVAKDPVEAVRWFRKAAEAGASNAMERLGEAYIRGHGVARDPVAGARWLRQAADAGNTVAMRRLAEAYQKGDGVAKDEAEAQKWFAKARQ